MNLYQLDDNEYNILYDFTINVICNESYKYIKGNTKKGKKAISDLKGWDIEDIKIER